MQAIIFDMDGVLIDSEPLWHQAEKEAFATIGVELSTEDCLKTTGLRIDEVVRYWDAPSELVERIIVRMVALIGSQGVAKPGVAEALASCTSWPLAIASSSPFRIIDAVLARLHLREHFKVVHSAEHEARGKPDPAVYLAAARLLDIAPEQCLAIEDSPNGVLAAKRAGMVCIAVPESDAMHGRLSHADQIIPSLHALPAALARIAAP